MDAGKDYPGRHAGGNQRASGKRTLWKKAGVGAVGKREEEMNSKTRGGTIAVILG